METLSKETLREISRIKGRGLTQVIIPRLDPFSWYAFLNGEYVDPVRLEDLMIQLDVPDDGDFSRSVVRGHLSLGEKDATGGFVSKNRDLFPGVVDIVIGGGDQKPGHRFVISCPNPRNIETAWVQTGLSDDGGTFNLEGMNEFQILISPGIVDVKVVWQGENATAGEVECLFRESGVLN
jgi:hypothetical protein